MVGVENRDGVAVITLRRPEKLNALSTALLHELIAALSEAERSAETRVAVLTGTGRAFCAGADIEEYSHLTQATFAAYQELGKKALDAISGNRKPVIGAANGDAFGGGFELLLACDLIVAPEAARFGLPEVRLGLLPGGGGTQRLPRALGPYLGRELLMTGRSLTGRDLAQLGLVNRAVPADEVLREARDLAGEIAARAPLAAQAAKRVVAEGLDLGLPSALELEGRVLLGLFGSADGQEGIRAFVEKRSPKFTGA